MKTSVGTVCVVVIGLAGMVAAPQDDPGTPAEQYAKLLREYRPASGGIRGAKTDLERKAAVERMATFPQRFVGLAERHSKDPIVLEVLRQAVQIVNSTDSAAQIAWETNRSHFPSGCADDSAVRIVDLLARDHIESGKLEPILDRMRYGYRTEFESFLSAVLDENPHREIRALACLALARFLNDKLRAIQLAEDRAELIQCYEIVFGKDYLPGLQRPGRVELAKRIETLFERAAKYDDVTTLAGGTVAEQAKMELYEIHKLGVGKVAPDIEGTDQGGQGFKLSDYRGKVVLLYFWVEL